MASCFITKEIESRLKQIPEHLFEVFLEIQKPIHQESPEILIKYPDDYSDQILKSAASFAYPCQIPSDEQSEHFAFVVLDSTGSIFRFGYCRRSNRESTCLCLISYYPWFEIFYTILNDLSQIINSKSVTDVETFLSSLYNYKLISNEGIIEVNSPSKDYTYSRPDQHKLPSMLTNRNFSVMFSRLGPDIMLRLFAHLIFERRILFVSSKLFHLTACACGCLSLINPMHWQSIFLPILPESMSWTAQCTAPFIIGIHSSIYSKMNRNELGDVVIINIDEKTIESEYDDLSVFPKDLIRSMKKGIQQSSQLIGDHLARVFLRTMAFIIGNYASGFVMKNEKQDFDREIYLQQYVGSDLNTFMSSVANTQMFEQFSRYRASIQLERETDIDEFDIEVKNLEQIRQPKKLKSNKKIYKLLEKATNPLIDQVQNKAEKLQTAINKAGQRVVNEALLVRNHLTSLDTKDAIKRKTGDSIESNHLTVQQANTSDLLNGKYNLSSSSSRSSSPELEQYQTDSLINFDAEQILLLPSPVVVNVIDTPLLSEIPRQTPQIDSKIRQLQNELQYKVQIFDGKRMDPRDEYGEQQTEIKKLVKQFDPLDDDNFLNKTSPLLFRSDDKFSSTDVSDRHPSIYETIPANRVNNILKNIQSNYGTNSRNNVRPGYSVQQLSVTAPAFLSTSIFDPLAPATTNNLSPHLPTSAPSETNGMNLIDLY